MVVYIEDCLIENFLVTFLLLKLVCNIYKQKPKKHRVWLACFFGAVMSTLYPIFGFSGLLEIAFKLCVGVLIICIAFGYFKFWAKYIIFILLTALYGGVNILLYYWTYGSLEITDNFPTYILIAILFLIYYLFNSCLKIMQKNYVINNFVYNICIINENIKIFDTAFLDSGNTLLNEESEPIFIINLKIFNKLFKNIKLEEILTKNFKNLKEPKYVKSGFASGSGKILTFKINKLIILNANKNIEISNATLGLVYSKFYKNFSCNMLLNVNTFV